MVKITLEFPNVDQAIVALGKLALLKTAPAPKAVTVPNPETPSDADLKTRKPRADAGKPRGKYKKDAGASAPTVTTASDQASNGPLAATDPGKEAEKAIVPTSTSATAPKAEQSAATNAPAPTATAYGRSIGGPAELHNLPKAGHAPTATQEEVQAAIEALFEAKDLNVTRAVLGRFGAKRGQDLLPEHRADFIKLANDVREGKAQP